MKDKKKTFKQEYKTKWGYRKVDTYEGIKASVNMWLESGQLTNINENLPQNKQKSLKRAIFNLGKKIQTYERKKEVKYKGKSSNKIERQIVKEFNTMFRGEFKPINFKGVNIRSGLFEINPNSNKIEAKVSRRIPIKAPPSIGGINTLDNIFDNWSNVKKVMVDYNVMSNSFMGAIGDYPDWESRFLLAAGFYAASDKSGGVGNRSLLSLLVAIQANEAFINTLNSYLKQNNIIIDLDNPDTSIYYTIRSINNKEDKTGEDMVAVEILENIYKLMK